MDTVRPGASSYQVTYFTNNNESSTTTSSKPADSENASVKNSNTNIDRPGTPIKTDSKVTSFNNNNESSTTTSSKPADSDSENASVKNTNIDRPGPPIKTDSKVTSFNNNNESSTTTSSKPADSDSENASVKNTNIDRPGPPIKTDSKVTSFNNNNESSATTSSKPADSDSENASVKNTNIDGPGTPIKTDIKVNNFSNNNESSATTSSKPADSEKAHPLIKLKNVSSLTYTTIKRVLKQKNLKLDMHQLYEKSFVSEERNLFIAEIEEKVQHDLNANWRINAYNLHVFEIAHLIVRAYIKFIKFYSINCNEMRKKLDLADAIKNVSLPESYLSNLRMLFSHFFEIEELEENVFRTNSKDQFMNLLKKTCYQSLCEFSQKYEKKDTKVKFGFKVCALCRTGEMQLVFMGSCCSLPYCLPCFYQYVKANFFYSQVQTSQNTHLRMNCCLDSITLTPDDVILLCNEDSNLLRYYQPLETHIQINTKLGIASYFSNYLTYVQRFRDVFVNNSYSIIHHPEYFDKPYNEDDELIKEKAIQLLDLQEIFFVYLSEEETDDLTASSCDMKLAYFFIAAYIQNQINFTEDELSKELLTQALEGVKYIKDLSTKSTFLDYVTPLLSHYEINIISAFEYPKKKLFRIFSCFKLDKDVFVMRSDVFAKLQACNKHGSLFSANKNIKYKFANCDLCYADDQVVVNRECCDKYVCISCLQTWVKTRVLTRNIQVSCAMCNSHITKDEVRVLMGDDVHRFEEIVCDIKGDQREKTCPKCMHITRRPPRSRKIRIRREEPPITCKRCQFVWCYSCHSPQHPGLTCSQNLDTDHMLHQWRKQMDEDLAPKAQICPNILCRAIIERNEGCDHMTCAKCHREFCYICRKLWLPGNLMLPIFGTHSSKYGIAGCKKNLFPEKPLLRKLIRGSLFFLEITFGIPLVAVLAGLALGILPLAGLGFGVYLLVKCFKKGYSCSCC